MEKRRSAIVAVVLSMGMPGLGHLYCGRWLLTLLFFPLCFAGPAVFIGGWVVLGWSLRAAFWAGCAAWWLVVIAAAVHAGLLARKAGEAYRLRTFNLWYFYLLVWLLGALLPTWGIYQAIRTNFLATFDLASDSMFPTLIPGDKVIVDRRPSSLEDLKRGTIVAVLDPADPDTVRLLRVVGQGGDKLELGAGGLALNQGPVPRREVGPGTYERQGPNGDWVTVEYIRTGEELGEVKFEVIEDTDPARRRVGKWEVGPGKLLLLGDNRIHGVDSFSFGPVERSALIGRAISVFASKDPRTREWRKDRRGLPLP